MGVSERFLSDCFNFLSEVGYKVMARNIEKRERYKIFNENELVKYPMISRKQN